MKNQYEIIRPREEETVSTLVLNLYNELCNDIMTIPWAIFKCGQALAEWYTSKSKDYVFYDYVFRIVYDMSCQLSENSDYNIDLK